MPFYKQKIVNETKWKVEFWDTAGQDRFDRLHASYYFGAHSCLLVFDVTRKITYSNLYARVCMSVFTHFREKWYSELRQYCPSIPVICLANKIDADMSATQRTFNFPIRHELPLFFVSAGSGVNVVRAFNESIKSGVEFSQKPSDNPLVVLRKLIENDL
jgi:Rab-like protein 2